MSAETLRGRFLALPRDLLFAYGEAAFRERFDWASLTKRAPYWLLNGIDSQAVAYLAGLSARGNAEEVRWAFDMALSDLDLPGIPPDETGTEAFVEAMIVILDASNAPVGDLLPLVRDAIWAADLKSQLFDRYGELASLSLMEDEATADEFNRTIRSRLRYYVTAYHLVR